MRARKFRLLYVLVCIAVALSAFAQEGHPLVGSWNGTWGPSPDHRNDVTVIMNWDGKEITGILNPGRNSIPIQKATLDPNTWTLRFEAEAQDHKGQTVRYVIEGKLQDIGSPNRSIIGTWSHGNVKGDFKITRY